MKVLGIDSSGLVASVAVVEDDIFEELALISDYDFASDLNVNILG